MVRQYGGETECRTFEISFVIVYCTLWMVMLYERWVGCILVVCYVFLKWVK